MMSRLMRGGAGLLAVLAISAGSAQAGGCLDCLFHHGKGCRSCCSPARCCQTCQQPPTICTCTTMRPVVETCYRQQQCVTYRNICETHYRKEQCVQKVPVTTCRDVTVDEGCYQMVWVPKLVTKKVAQTCYQDQVFERTVPYSCMRTVPQVTTRMVPERRVRYVPHQTQMVINGGCGPCGPCGPTYGVPPWIAPSTPTVVPGRVSPSDPNPVPDPRTPAYEEEVPPSGPDDVAFSQSSRTGKFVPAPSSAAMVWRGRNNIVRP